MQSYEHGLIDRLERAERRFRRLCGLGLALVIGGVLLISRPAATAQQGNGLEQRVAALEQAVASLQTASSNQATQISALQTTVANQVSQIAALQTASSNQANQISALQTLSSNQATQIAALQSGVTSLGTQIAGLQTSLSFETAARQLGDAALQIEATDLQDKTQFISVSTGEMFIKGTNLHIVNGLGATNGFPADPYAAPGVVNGKGNLIIGYNESSVPNGQSDNRTGSHNLIVGTGLNYNSFGGINAGLFNNIYGVYASVLGGEGNTASGDGSTVSGGGSNIASGVGSSVSGGSGNRASNVGSTISGGQNVTDAGYLGWAGGSYHTP